MVKRRRKKKSYNPFKIWLTWFGAIVGLIFSPWQVTPGFYGDIMFNYERILQIIETPAQPALTYIKVFILVPIVWFLVAWGVHVFIRKTLKW